MPDKKATLNSENWQEIPNRAEFKRLCRAKFSAFALSRFCVGRWYFHSFELSLCSTLVFALITLCLTLVFSLISNFSRRMSKKRPERNMHFQSRHAVEFGLRICKRSAGASTIVVTTVCRFCEVFGKEEAVV